MKQAILDTIELPLKHRWVTGHRAATPTAAQAETVQPMRGVAGSPRQPHTTWAAAHHMCTCCHSVPQCAFHAAISQAAATRWFPSSCQPNLLCISSVAGVCLRLACGGAPVCCCMGPQAVARHCWRKQSPHRYESTATCHTSTAAPRRVHAQRCSALHAALLCLPARACELHTSGPLGGFCRCCAGN